MAAAALLTAFSPWVIQEFPQQSEAQEDMGESCPTPNMPTLCEGESPGQRVPILQAAFDLPHWIFIFIFLVPTITPCFFSSPPPPESDPVEHLLTSKKVLNKSLSWLYFHLSIAYTSNLTKTLRKWQLDLPDLAEYKWENCLSSYVSIMVSARDHFLQTQVLTQSIFYSAKIDGDLPLYSRLVSGVVCLRPPMHMIWSCPSLHLFWMVVLADINQVTNLTLELDPKQLLLNIFDEQVMSRYSKLFVMLLSMHVGRYFCVGELLLHQTNSYGRRSVLNSVLLLYKITYINRNCPGKFDKIWSDWIDSWGSVRDAASPPRLDDEP